jgi:hypothetical protein
MSLKKALTTYPHHIDTLKKQNSFIVKLVKLYGVGTVITELETILADGSIDQICDALLFLRDVSLYQERNPSFAPTVTQFRNALPDSRVFSLLEKQLYSESQQVRHNTIFAFGKMSFKENAARLHKAIDTYEKKYPSELGQLLQELAWLSQLAT